MIPDDHPRIFTTFTEVAGCCPYKIEATINCQSPEAPEHTKDSRT